LILFFNRPPVALAALVVFAASGSALALSLGEIAVRSSVGLPFEAVLPFSAGAGESVSAQCIHARDDGVSAHPAVPALANPQLSVNARRGGGEIVVRTRAAVGEPVVRLRITLDCAPATLLSREFLVLLDAPVPVAEQVAVTPLALAGADAAPTSAERRRPRRAERGDRSEAAARPARDPATAEAAARTAPGPNLRMAPGMGDARSGPLPAARAKARGAGFRLTLSRPEDDVLQKVPSLRRSEQLLSLAAPVPERSEADREILRLQARMALADNPLAEAMQLQARLSALESNLAALGKQVAQGEAARAAAEDKARLLAEENRRLAARLDSFAVVAVMLALVTLAAAGLWRYRVAAERRARSLRDWEAVAKPAADHAPPDSPEKRAPAHGQVAADLQARHAQSVVSDSAGPADAGTRRPGAVPLVPTPLASAAPGPSGAAAGPLRAGGAPAPLPAGEPAAFELPPAPPPPAAAPAGHAMDSPDAGAAAPVQPASVQPALPAVIMPLVPGRAWTFSRAAGATGPALAPGPGAASKTADSIEFALATPDHDALDGVTDAQAEARGEQYMREFERKLFPEIALGRAKLDEPRSIIGLARTYYQEDFDPAKAISFLEYALHRSTDSMLIHLALLEVLRMERRVREYASFARAFRDRYPDSGTCLQLIAAYGRLLDPSNPDFDGAPVPGLDLDTPSNWLGNTIDMTKYVLGQKVAASVRDLPVPVPLEGA
jgi:pilus assembly protein FimV